MDLAKLKSYEPPPHRYTPSYAGNRDDGEPFVVLHRPLIRAYQLEVLDLQARMQEAHPGEDAGAKALRAFAAESDRALAEYHRRVLEAHLVGVEGLLADGEEATVAQFIDACESMPDLVTELIAAIRDAGTLSGDDTGN